MSTLRRLIRGTLWLVLLPLLLYLLCFILLTWPLLRLFSTHLYCDPGDGFQNAWNIWWVNRSITQLHQLPYYTSYLFYPRGVTLLGHTLNAFNGLLCIPLLRFCSFVQAYNTVILFSFATSGWTAFLLAHRFSRSYLGSLAAGFIFTFSGYHFAHANGHMQLTAVEWLPLGILCVYELLTRPRVAIGLAAAGVLWLTLLCDYYYFFYICMTAFLLYGVRAWQERSISFIFRPPYRGPVLALAIGAALTCGPIVAELLISNFFDPFTGVHDPVLWSANVLAPFIPGESWRFAALTRGYWSRLPEARQLGWPVVEGDVYLGWLVLAMLVVMMFRRARRGFENLGFWYLVLAIFWLLALGPRLQLPGGRQPIPLPYALLAKLFPPLRLSGMPVRMMVMAILASAVLFSCAFHVLTRRLRGSWRWIVPLLLLAALAIEQLPKPLARTSPAVPPYVLALRDLPGRGGVIDMAANMFQKLYYQTVHQKPIAGGYISREPSSAAVQRGQIEQLAYAHDFSTLHDTYGFDYLVTPELIDDPDAHLVFEGSAIRIYALGTPGKPAPTAP